MNLPRTRASVPIRVFCSVVASSLLLSVASAQIYDAAEDFSFVHNPNGPWRYGSSQEFDSPFDLSKIAVSFPGTPIAGWVSSGAAPGYPFTLTAAFNFQWGTSIFAPGWLSLHPQNFGAYSVVKWIAPSTGLYHVNSVFKSFNSTASNQAATVDTLVRVNQVAVWSDVLGSSNKGTQSFQALELSTGDHVDFMVGSRGPSDFDNVGFQATVTFVSPFVPVPEPETFGLIGAAGLLAYSVFRQRRNTAT